MATNRPDPGIRDFKENNNLKMASKVLWEGWEGDSGQELYTF